MIENPGKYLAKCVDDPSAVRFGRAKTGSEQIALTFALVDDSGRVDHGATIDWVGSFANDKSTEITIKALRACGWTGNDLTDLRGINDLEVELDVQLEEYQGEQRLRVRWVNKPGGGRIKFADELDQRSRQALAARLKQRAAAIAPTGGQRAPGRPSAGGDNIPF